MLVWRVDRCVARLRRYDHYPNASEVEPALAMPVAAFGETATEVVDSRRRWADENTNSPVDPVVAETGDSGKNGEEELEEVSLGERPPMDEEMDMTPMVDVTFLLLIFFMVTASFASEKVIQQKATKKEASASTVVQVSDVLTIRIDDLNTFLVMMPDQSEIDASNKQDLLIALNNARREGLLDDVENVKVEAHQSSIHAALVAALDACRNEGLSNFNVKVVEDFE